MKNEDFQDEEFFKNGSSFHVKQIQLNEFYDYGWILRGHYKVVNETNLLFVLSFVWEFSWDFSTGLGADFCCPGVCLEYYIR